MPKAFDVPDELWDRIRPLIPAGRARTSTSAC